MNAVISVSDAKKTFGQTPALVGASLELRKGEFLALLGPNGAGKTTLIRAIAGRVRLDSGSITVFGEPGGTHATQELRRRVGIVPQEIALYPTLTARENLEVFGTLSGLRGSTLKDRIAWALDFTGLADRHADLTKGFSGGMKRRLNIACSVLHRPEALLLDEPTVGVDPQSRQHIWEMLAKLRADGASLLLTSHQLDEVQTLCERIVIIDHGAVIESGTLDEIVHRTIGTARRVTLRLDAPITAPLAASLSAEVPAGDPAIVLKLNNVAAELTPVLATLNSAGRRVEDVHVQSPSLHSVFLHLTGRELRE